MENTKQFLPVKYSNAPKTFVLLHNAAPLRTDLDSMGIACRYAKYFFHTFNIPAISAKVSTGWNSDNRLRSAIVWIHPVIVIVDWEEFTVLSAWYQLSEMPMLWTWDRLVDALPIPEAHNICYIITWHLLSLAQEKIPQTSYPMSITWASHMANTVIVDTMLTG